MSSKKFWFVLFLHYKSVKDLSSCRAVALDLSKANKIQKYGKIYFHIYEDKIILVYFMNILRTSSDQKTLLHLNLNALS